MNKIEIEELKKQIKILENFQTSKIHFSGGDIVEWVAECVSIFSKININTEIISFFINSFKPREEEILNEWGGKDIYTTMGPFKKKIKGLSLIVDDAHSLGYTIESQAYSAYVAFKAAVSKLNMINEENKLVPSFLLDNIDDTKHPHLIQSLQLIEKAYQDKNPEGLYTNSSTLLQSILILEKSLEKNKPGERLDKLIKDKSLRKKFVPNCDIIKALNNSRIIRNLKVEHKESMPSRSNIPFLVAVSCAYLVIFFLETTLATGEIIKLNE